MSDQQWDVLEFVKPLRKDEIDGQSENTADVLSPEQIEELHRLLLEAEGSI
jgi:hypothetical protein